MSDILMPFEEEYFNKIKHNCKVIFDVGVGNFSVFFDKEEFDVHYFEPHTKSFNEIKNREIKNKNSYINNFGLSNENNVLPLYDEGSLYNRHLSNKIIDNCVVKTGTEYCVDNNITNIDFLKIDVEGMETKVLLGFGDLLKNIRYIQFEYGIGLRDAGSNLKEIMDLLIPYGFHEFYKNGIERLNSSNDFWEWCNINTENTNFIKND
jgi:FkbM family methyltransferase